MLDLDKLRKNPGYQNWLAVGNAFRLLCEGLRPFAEDKMRDWHKILLSRVGGTNCSCTYDRSRPNRHHDTTTCRWAQEVEGCHRNTDKKKIPWDQSDKTKWLDPTDGYWQIAKLFMSVGKEASTTVKDPSTTDISGLLNLLNWCKHTRVSRTLVREVRECRNKWAHAADLLVSDSDKNLIFDKIEKLLTDTELMKCKEVRDCRAAIVQLRNKKESMSTEEETKIVMENLQFIKSEISEKISDVYEGFLDAKEEIHGVKEGLSGAKDEILKKLELLENVLSKVTEDPVKKERFSVPRPKQYKYWFFFLSLLMLVLAVLYLSISPLFSSENECCPRATKGSPISHYSFQEFDFSDYLCDKTKQFIGRKWLFEKFENIFDKSNSRPGVLMIAEPGFGKSASMSQLICSPSSSLLIHNNIMGYHMCDYAEKEKRNGGRLVRNLVHQIAGNNKEYADYITKNKLIRDTLNDKCKSDPVGCFRSAIVAPFKKLNDHLNNNQYIIIDALDECFEKGKEDSQILDILTNLDFTSFPSRLKLILTSRNRRDVVDELSKTFEKMIMDPRDHHNMANVHCYIRQNLTPDIKKWDIDNLINWLSEKHQGNFLFAKLFVDYVKEEIRKNGSVDLESIPETLHDFYAKSFRRRYTKLQLIRFTPILEVILTTSNPLNTTEIAATLNAKVNEIRELIKQLYSYLRFGSRGSVHIYHKSFGDWLMNQTDGTQGLTILKPRGHEYIADYFLSRFYNGDTEVTVENLEVLSMHVLSAGMQEKHIQHLGQLNVSGVKDWWNRTILHKLAANKDMAPILAIFLRSFYSADIVDKSGQTPPACIAAREGNTKNLNEFIKNGIDIKQLVYTCKGGGWYNSMLHMAASMGYTETVRLMLENNVTLNNTILPYTELTPLRLATQGGHLEVVKLLHQAGAKPDFFALHLAAQYNHSNLAEYFLTKGVRDQCIPHKHSFFLNNEYAGHHLCQTALHMAVYQRNLQFVKTLLSFGVVVGLEGRDEAGRTPFLVAVERKFVEITKQLLRSGADVESEYYFGSDSEGECHYWGSISNYTPRLSRSIRFTRYLEWPHGNVCVCGQKAIHVAAKYGSWEIAKELIYGNASKWTRDCEGLTALHIAAYYDRVDFIRQFNRTVGELNILGANNETLLHLAALGGSETTLQLLVNDKTTNVLTTDKNGMTPFHYAAGEYHYNGVSLIKQFSFGINKKTRTEPWKISDRMQGRGWKLESLKREKILKLLTKAKGRGNVSLLINARDKTRRTALHYAAATGFKDVIAHLVQFGSEWNVTDQDGNTPLALALKNAPIHYTDGCDTTTEKDRSHCFPTVFDETVEYLIQNFDLRKCTLESASLLRNVQSRNMLLSEYHLLRAGLNASCSV